MSPDRTNEAVLGRVPLLAGLAADELARLAAVSAITTLEKDAILFLEGESSDRVFIVLSGLMRIYRISETGGELVLANLGPGESIGELSMIDELPRSASAQALERCRILSMPTERVRQVLLGNPAALMRAAVTIAATVRRLTGTTSDFVFLDLPHRLAKYLVALAVRDGDGATAMLPASQSGVAAQLGVTRQSLNQALGSLAGASLIEVHGRAVRVPDLEALENF